MRLLKLALFLYSVAWVIIFFVPWLVSTNLVPAYVILLILLILAFVYFKIFMWTFNGW
jgi:hypothetical protein